MKNIQTYLNESILSSVNSGAYARNEQLKKILLNSGISEDKIVIKSTKKDPTPYAIIKGDKGYAHFYEKVEIDGASERDIKVLNECNGIYYKQYGNLHPVDLIFKNTNNIKLDLSNWTKDSGYKQSIYFVNCKNVSLEDVPAFSGSGDPKIKELSFLNNTTVNNLPKDLGNAKIIVDDEKAISLSKLKSLKFNEFEFTPGYLGLKNYRVGYFQETFYDDYSLKEPSRHFNDTPHKLKKEFNAKIKPLVDALKNTRILFSSDVLVDYNKNTDTYIFMDEDWEFKYADKIKNAK